MRKVLLVLLAIAAAVLGAAAGKAVVQWRAQAAAGREPRLDLDSLRPSARQVVPGLIAALRVRDTPWSYLHIPSWLAAFAVNLGVVALAREAAPLLRALGIEAPDDDDDDEPPPARPQRPARGAVTPAEVWTAEVIPPAPQSPPTPGFRPFGG